MFDNKEYKNAMKPWDKILDKPLTHSYAMIKTGLS